jgi:hypothetical protein
MNACYNMIFMILLYIRSCGVLIQIIRALKLFPTYTKSDMEDLK